MRRSPFMTGLVLAGLATVLVACARMPGSSTDASNGSQEVGQSMAPIGEVPGGLLESIVADAAERAGVGPTDVSIIAAESVTWSDGSLGCPQPGMMYTQALVPGYRVVVDAGGEQMSFHASDRGNFRFCAKPKPPMEVNPNE